MWNLLLGILSCLERQIEYGIHVFATAATVELYSSTFQGSFHFQGLFKKSL